MEVVVLYLVVLSVIVAVGVFVFSWFRSGSVAVKFKIGMYIWIVSEKESFYEIQIQQRLSAVEEL